MFKSFDEIQNYIVTSGIKKKIALAAAHDDDALSSVVQAKRAGIISAILVGKTAETKKLLKELGEDPSDWEMIDESDEAACAKTAMQLVANKEADIPMKGIMQTSTFLKAMFSKTYGFVREGTLVSQATVCEYTPENRLIIISDCAINIAPTYEEKIKIIGNTVKLAKDLGCDMPKVAVLAPVETVNPAIPSTIEAAMLAKACDRGQIKGCIVDGPFGLDNAVSIEAAHHKNITSDVAGKADILIMPDLAAGNIFTKSLHYFAHLKTAGTAQGPAVPAIFSSRTDTAVDKFNAVMIAVLQAAR
jgi:phosphate butyryltransferase